MLNRCLAIFAQESELKKLTLTLAMVVCLSLPAFGVTGLGFGLHAGITNNYSYGVLDASLDVIADSLGISEGIKFDDELTSFGAHVKVGTLPIVDFYFFADYAWKKKELTSNIDLRLSDFSFGATAKKMFGFSVFKPYVGVGAGMHKLVYNIEGDLGDLILPLPDDQTKIGYHVAGGLELGIPILPLDPYAEFRYNWVTTEEKISKFGLISLGLTFSL
jgi:opacity protein-like surface antigen